MFLIPEDYKPYIRAEIKEDILMGQTNIIQQVEMASQEEISSYLSGRYDVTKIFINILTYNAIRTFQTGEYVYETGKIYRALEAVTDVSPTVNHVQENPKWVLDDPRNPLIVLRMVYITLYHAHKSLPGSQIPRLRIDDYDMSIRWLEKVAEGKLNPILPEAEKEDGVIVVYGSEERRQNRY